MTLPAEYTSLPFLGARGIPQTVPFTVGSRQLRLTIVAAVTDLPALRSLPATQVLFDGGLAERTRPTTVPASPRDRFVAPPPHTLDPDVVRPMLVISDGATTLGSQPILVGTPIVIGATAGAPLLVEVLFDTLVLSVGTLTQPGELGGAIVAGARIRNLGVPRFENAPGPLVKKKKVKVTATPVLAQASDASGGDLVHADVSHIDISYVEVPELVTLLPVVWTVA